MNLSRRLIVCVLAAAPAPKAAVEQAARAPSAAAPRASAKVEAAGLHNVYRISAKLYSGSSPDGDEGFASLAKLGVRTIISVDGAEPDVARARRHGMRYVHLPIGYDGVPRRQALRLAKAVRDLPGPVYLHCHHGQHRGPAAAAVVHLCLDERCSVETALAELRRAGADPHYVGLYAAPRTIRRPTAAELNELPAEFPEVTPAPALAQLMVSIDEHADHLKEMRAGSWKPLRDAPDLDPPHVALQIAEQCREAARLPAVRGRPDEFRRWLADAEARARDLENVLRGAAPSPAGSAASADAALRRVNAACVRCHAKYRDVPQTP